MSDEEALRKYKIVAVLWNDPHIMFRSNLPDSENIAEFIVPTLTVGILFNDNKNFITLLHTLERGETHDESDFTFIIRGCIISIKEYGEIELAEIRSKGAN